MGTSSCMGTFMRPKLRRGVADPGRGGGPGSGAVESTSGLGTDRRVNVNASA